MISDLVDVDFVALHGLLGPLLPATGGLLSNCLLGRLSGFLLTGLWGHVCCCLLDLAKVRGGQAAMSERASESGCT